MPVMQCKQGCTNDEDIHFCSGPWDMRSGCYGPDCLLFSFLTLRTLFYVYINASFTDIGSIQISYSNYLSLFLPETNTQVSLQDITMQSKVFLFALTASLVSAAKFSNSDFTGIAAGTPFEITWIDASGPVTINLKSGPSSNLNDGATIGSEFSLYSNRKIDWLIV